MAKQKQPGMGINEENDERGTRNEEPAPSNPQSPIPNPESARPRQTGRPLCPIHAVQMLAYATSAMFTYYKCPMEGCLQRKKLVRPIGPLKGKYGT
jgi:hypothetical protein